MIGMASKIDKLFALKAVEQKVKEERELLEYECRDELLEAYAKDGTDRRTSTFFGPDAGKFSIKRFKAKPGKTVTEYNLADDEAFADWLADNPSAASRFAKLHAADLAEWWFDANGELTDGVSRVEYEEEGTPERVTAQVYSFKPDVVIERLGGNLLEGANRLMLGESDG